MPKTCLTIAFYLLFLSVFALSCKKNTAFVDTQPSTSAKKSVANVTISEEKADKSQEIDHLIADFERKDRVIWQRPDKVIECLGNLEQKTVADIGAGTGYFAFRLVPKAKRVIAIDIDPRFIQFMDSTKSRVLNKNLQSRFEARLATLDDPKLRMGEVNHVMLVNTYHQIAQRPAYFEQLRKKMIKGGKLLIIDFKKKDLPVGPPKNLKLDAAQVEAELHIAGFKNIQVDEKTLDYQYIITALVE
jgi:ubiquinone/menaquinone biosynthesis C-methylase UbiE